MKRITIRGKPTSKKPINSPDDWVANRLADDEPMKRLTIDIPLWLHQSVKSQCALDGENMADVVRQFLIDRYADKGRRSTPGQESPVALAIPELT